MLYGKEKEKESKLVGSRSTMIKIGDLVKYKPTGSIGLVTHWHCLTRGYAHVYFGWNNPHTKYPTPASGSPIQEAHLEVIR